MPGRGKRGRGRGSRTPLSRKSRTPITVKKPLYITQAQALNESDRESNHSRSSTPISSRSTISKSSSKLEPRSSSRQSAKKTKLFMQNVLNNDDEPLDDSLNEHESPLLCNPSDEDADEMQSNNSSDTESSFNDELSDDSDSSFYNTPRKTPRWLPPRSKTPELIDPKDIPPLCIPESSSDLVIGNEYLMQALGLYEVLRRYRTNLRLSPFRFEDFCAALITDEQSCLISEVHISLMKALYREEDVNNTVFGPSDVKDSINILFNTVDSMTWQELARSYLSSDKLPEFREALPALEQPDYATMSTPHRLQILQTLTDIFLTSSSVREDIMNEGNLKYDDHCRNCHKPGDLLCCEMCSAVYHLTCVDPPLENVPDDDWICTVCVAHQVKGVVDCVSDLEKNGLLIRQDILGVDRHGRSYHFLARRIIVESGDDVWYYSTPEQLDELLYVLDPVKWERHLVEALEDMRDEIIKQMGITEHLTDKFKAGKKSLLEIEIDKIKKTQEERKLQKQKEDDERMKRIQEEQRKADEEAQNKLSEEVEDKENGDVVDSEKDCIGDSTKDNDSVISAEHTSQSSSSAMETSTITSVNSDGSITKTVMEEVTTTTVTTTSSTIVGSGSGDADIRSQGMADNKINDDAVPKKATSLLTTMQDGPEKRIIIINKDGQKMAVAVKPKTPETSDSASSYTVTADGRGIVTRSKTGSLTPRQFTDSVSLTTSSLRTATSKSEDTILVLNKDGELTRITRSQASKSTVLSQHSIYFKLGMEGSYKSYVNQYSANSLALNKAQHQEERDKRRYLSHKFSLTPASEFKWSGSIHGSKPLTISTLRMTIIQLESSLPSAFMHSNWQSSRNNWNKAVHMCNTPRDFALALAILETCIKPVACNPIWHENLGHIALKRLTAAEREEAKKQEKSNKPGLEVEPIRLNWCKYTLGLKHQVWKQKGEEYRVHGGDGWLWQSATRCYRIVPQDTVGLRGIAKKLLLKQEKLKVVKNADIKEQKTEDVEDVAMKTEPLVTMPKDGSGDAPMTTTTHARDIKMETEEPELKKEPIMGSPETNGIVFDTYPSGMKKKIDADVVDVSASLLNRTYYAKVGKPYARLDCLLERRQKQYEVEQKQKIAITQIINRYKATDSLKKKSESLGGSKNDDDVDVVGEDKHETTGVAEEELMKGVLDATKQGPSYLCYSALCRCNSSMPPGDLFDQCYSVSCDAEHVQKDDDDSSENKADQSQSDETITDKPDSQLSKDEKSKEHNESMEVDVTGDDDTNEIAQDPKPLQKDNINDENNCKSLCINSDEQNETPEKKTIPKLDSDKEVKQMAPKVGETSDTSSKTKKLPAKTTNTSALLPALNHTVVGQMIASFIQGGKIQLTPTTVIELEQKMANVGHSSQPVQLCKVSRMARRQKLKKGSLPICLKFTTRHNKRSPFILEKNEQRKISRCAGRKEASGFNYNCKMNNVQWPYPCPRPLFKTCWRYRTQMLKTLSAAAQQLRILWACLRWDDMAAKPPPGGTNTITTDESITTTELLKRRDIGPYNLRSEYLVRKIIVPIGVPTQPREEYTPIRSGLRKRKRPESPRQREPTVSETWIPEESLELWEIKLFSDKVEKQRQAIQDKITAVAQAQAAQKVALQQKSTSPLVTTPSGTAKSAAQIREELEIQLRKQRQAMQQKRMEQLKGPVSGGNPLVSIITSTNSSVAGNQPVKIITSAQLKDRLAPRLVTTSAVSPQGKGLQTVRLIATPGPGGVTTMKMTPVKTSSATVSPGNITRPIGQKSFFTGAGGRYGTSGQISLPSTTINVRPKMTVTQATPGVLAGAAANRPIAPGTPATKPSGTVQNLRIIQGQNGQIQVQGLLPGQQIVKLPDGRLQLITVPAATGQIQQAPQAQVVPSETASTPTNNLVQQQPAGDVQIPTVVQQPQQAQRMVVMQSPATAGQLQAQKTIQIMQGGQIIRATTPLVQQASSAAPVLAAQPQLVQQPKLAVVASSGQPALITTPKSVLTDVSKIASGKQLGTSAVVPQPATQGVQKAVQIVQTPTTPATNLGSGQLTQAVGTRVGNQIVYRNVSSVSSASNSSSTSSAVTTAVTQITASTTTASLSPKVPVLTTAMPDSPTKSPSSPNIPTSPPSTTELIAQALRGGGGVPGDTKYAVTPKVVQQVVRQAMLQNQDPDIQAKLMAMQKQIETENPIPTQATIQSTPVIVSKAQPQVVNKIIQGSSAVANEKEIPKPAPSRKRPKETPEQKQQRLANNKLSTTLFKQKEVLKKEIQRKRALLDKAITSEVHNEIQGVLQEQYKLQQQQPYDQNGDEEFSPPQSKKSKKNKFISTGTASKAPSKSSNKLYCICKTLFDESKFYVGCDLCSNWYHGSCIGITEAQSRVMESYICNDCKSQQENSSEELYCLCRTPYDDTQFYIGCDRCQDWFHGRCVGVSEGEADKMETYICPNCQRGESESASTSQRVITERVKDELKRLIRAITNHKMAWPFLKPVDPTEVPDYYQVIKEPMDLSTIEKKLVSNQYLFLGDLTKDMTKIFDNCRHYNPKNSSFYTCAEICETFFIQKLKNMKL